jgi:putative ABC transport system permease protein
MAARVRHARVDRWFVWEDMPASGRPRVEVAPLDYADWSREVGAFEDVAAYGHTSFSLTGDGTPERIAGTFVTPNLFSMLGVEAIAGRGPAVPEGSPGEATVAVLSYGLWQRRFGGDPAEPECIRGGRRSAIP